MTAQKVFDNAKTDLFAVATFMQSHEKQIVEQMALDTTAARELANHVEELHSLVESMLAFQMNYSKRGDK